MQQGASMEPITLMACQFSVGILVVSDSCSANTASDTSGTNLMSLVNSFCTEDGSKPFGADTYAIVSDDVEVIKNKLITWADQRRLNLILTTGGSGFGPRDVTPEATRQVIERDAASLTNAILFESMRITKFAMLSRAIAGIRGSTLIINLPGSKKGSQEALQVVLPVLKHALDLMSDAQPAIRADHCRIQDSSVKNQQHDHTQVHRHAHSEHHQGLQQQKHIHIHHHHNHNSHSHHHEQRHHHHTQCDLNETVESRLTSAEIAGRPRHSPYPMISVERALELVMAHTAPCALESVWYTDALNRVCAQSVLAREPLPPFAASVKDGFAVRCTRDQLLTAALPGCSLDADTDPTATFEFDVVGTSFAGDELINLDLQEGQCVKINTGAPVPLCADAVVQIEDTVARALNADGQDSRIRVVSTSTCAGSSAGQVNIKIGQDIRQVGSDIAVGDEVVRAGSQIKAAQVGMCATVGALRVSVFARPTVALVSTGNELVAAPTLDANADATVPAPALRAGQIRDSNKSLLRAQLSLAGIGNVLDAGVAKDDANSVLAVFRHAMQSADVIISTGGVSMGDRDLVKDVLQKDLGCVIHFGRMNMKPGKPTTFATCEYGGKRKLIFCLPGNPVSAIVTFNLLVTPCLKKMMGFVEPNFTEIVVRCQFEAELDPRPEYHRAALKYPNAAQSASDPYPKAFSTGNQHSSRLLSMNEADVLVRLPARSASKSRVVVGDLMPALLVSNLN